MPTEEFNARLEDAVYDTVAAFYPDWADWPPERLHPVTAFLYAQLRPVMARMVAGNLPKV
jgi:hypothetical protein